MKNTIYIVVLLMVNILTINSQSHETKKADALFDNLSFIKAAEAYEKLAESNATAHVLKRLGDSYYKNVKMQEASEAYGKLFSSFNPEEAEYMFKYAQSLRAVNKFKESEKWMENFHRANKKDARGKNFTDEKAILANIKDKEPDYKIANLKGVNTKFSDFGVTEYGNTILFSSSRRSNVFVKRTHTRNDRNFLDIYKVVKGNTNPKDAKPMFSDRINTKYHESSVSFSPDRKTMYFTRNNYNKGKFKTNKEGYNKLKIFKAEWVKNKWVNVIELPFCSNEYSVGHPTVSKDGKRLYFVSDMPGGIGATDLYFTDINEDDTFGLVQNLGVNVNTEGRELFPFISDNDELYFSSEGHFGIGALDIFKSKMVNGEFQKPVNLKAPINSVLDDFAFSINNETKKGYLSSNRVGGVGDDDIYSIVSLEKNPIEEPEEIIVAECIQMVKGIIKESKFGNTLAYAKLILKDAEGTIIKDTIAGPEGKFLFNLPCNKKYSVTASHEYYKPDSDSFVTTQAISVELNLDFALKIVDDFKYNKNDELVIKINTIYFDYNKWNIRPDAAIELDHIVRIMKKYPKIEVQSGSHTDARGKAAYNLSLSEKRANSTVDYILSKGISGNRISGKGYGETKLTNKCIDNDSHSNRVYCSKEQHQANRRTAFVVLNVTSSKKIISKNKEVDNKQYQEFKDTAKKHIIQKDETLYSISNKYNITINELKELNKLRSNIIFTGQHLLLEPKNIDPSQRTHVVKKDETLLSISKKYNISIQRLKELNNLKTNAIKPTQVLKIK